MEWRSIRSGRGMRNRKTRAFHILAILIPELGIKKRALRELRWNAPSNLVCTLIIVEVEVALVSVYLQQLEFNQTTHFVE